MTPQEQQAREHEAILQELRENSSSLRRLGEIIQEALLKKNEDDSKKFGDLWKAVHEERRRLDKALRMAEQTRDIMWKIGGALILALVASVLKVIGLY